MDIKKYQQWTITTAIYPGAGEHGFNEILYLTLGLASEAGEVAGKLKKIIRGDKVEPQAFLSELSDVLWYMVRICDNLNIDMEQLAEYNVGKLEQRKALGTIQGSGDDDASRITTLNV